MTDQNEMTPPASPEEPELEPLKCVVGFIATEPELRDTERGVPRFYARFGVEETRQEPGGGSGRREVRFHSLVAYRETARVAYERFQKHDVFIAQGRTKVNPRTGKQRFEAEQIGHNAARTRYEVDRSARHAPALEPSGMEVTRHGDRAGVPQGLVR